MPLAKKSPPEKPDIVPVVLATFVVAAICVVFAIFCFYYLISLESVGPEKKVEQTGQIVVSVVSSLLGAALVALGAYIIRRISR